MQTSKPRFFHSVKLLGGSLLEMLGTRLELFAIELSEEKDRLLALLGLLFATVVTGTLALVMISILVLVAFWDEYRWQALIGLSVFYVAVTAALVWFMQRRLTRRGPFFEATVAELRRDGMVFSAGRDK